MKVCPRLSAAEWVRGSEALQCCSLCAAPHRRLAPPPKHGRLPFEVEYFEPARNLFNAVSRSNG